MRESRVGGECGHSALYVSKLLNIKIKAMREEPTETSELNSWALSDSRPTAKKPA